MVLAVERGVNGKRFSDASGATVRPQSAREIMPIQGHRTPKFPATNQNPVEVSVFPEVFTARNPTSDDETTSKPHVNPFQTEHYAEPQGGSNLPTSADQNIRLCARSLTEVGKRPEWPLAPVWAFRTAWRRSVLIAPGTLPVVL
jgi:hypothetical protein